MDTFANSRLRLRTIQYRLSWVGTLAKMGLFVPLITALCLGGLLTGVSFAQYPANQQWTSYWQDCEGSTCFTDPITFSLNGAAWFVSVSGGTKIYQDYAQGFGINWATDPAQPYMVSWAIGNYQNGNATWVGSNSNGQLHNGCQPQTYPSNWTLVPCQESAENTNGHVFSGSWYVNYASNVGSYGWDYTGGVSIATQYFNTSTDYSEPVN